MGLSLYYEFILHYIKELRTYEAHVGPQDFLSFLKEERVTLSLFADVYGAQNNNDDSKTPDGVTILQIALYECEISRYMH